MAPAAASATCGARCGRFTRPSAHLSDRTHQLPPSWAQQGPGAELRVLQAMQAAPKKIPDMPRAFCMITAACLTHDISVRVQNSLSRHLFALGSSPMDLKNKIESTAKVYAPGVAPRILAEDGSV